MTRPLLPLLLALVLAAPAWAQDDVATVTFDDQTTGGQQVVVAQVFLPADGYVAIHDQSLLDGNVKGSVVGVSDYLEGGTYTDVVVTLFESDVPGLSDNADPAFLTQDTTLIAMPHMETNGNTEYNFLVSDEDGPYRTVDGGAVTDPAEVTVERASATFNDQTTGGRQVVVAEAYLPDGGYVAIHDQSLLDGNVKGSVVGVSDFLVAGRYEDVVVTLFESSVPGLVEMNADPAYLTQDTTLIAMPHMETNGNENYDFLVSGNDGPYRTADGGPVVDPAEVTVERASVTFEPQTTGGQQVVVARAYLPDGGYVAIHDGSLLDGNVKGSVVGVSEYLVAGTYSDVTVTLFEDDVPGLVEMNANPARLTQDTTLIAMPHMETSSNENYDFLVSDEDGPYRTDDGGPVVDPAEVAVEPSTVVFDDQGSGGRSVTVESVYLPDGGFVAIHDASLLDGNVLGSVVGVSEYLVAGRYEDVAVRLFQVPGMDGSQTTLAADDTTLIAMPHLDTNDNDRYDFLLTNGEEDGAYLDEDGAVTDAAAISVTSTPNETGPAGLAALTVEPNAPNPVSARTTIRFGVPEAASVRVTVYDVAGRAVAVLPERPVRAGWHEATVDASALAAGVYVYRVVAGDESVTGRMLVVR